MLGVVVGGLTALLLERGLLVLLLRPLGRAQSRWYGGLGLVMRGALLALALFQQQAWWVGFWAAGSALYLWVWWSNEDDEGRRRRRERLQRWRTAVQPLLPTPAPTPA